MNGPLSFVRINLFYTIGRHVGSEGIAPFILNHGTGSGEWFALHPGHSTPGNIGHSNCWIGGPQGRYGLTGEDTNVLLLLGMRLYSSLSAAGLDATLFQWSNLWFRMTLILCSESSWRLLQFWLWLSRLYSSNCHMNHRDGHTQDIHIGNIQSCCSLRQKLILQSEFDPTCCHWYRKQT